MSQSRRKVTRLYSNKELQKMIDWDKKRFPKHRYIVRNLDYQVLTVASMDENTRLWAAYIGPVQGRIHDLEWITVRNTGTRLPKEIAKILFPDVVDDYNWRM